MRTHPRLCLARGWAALWGPDFSFDDADRWAQLAQQAIAPGQTAETDLAGEVLALKALIAADRVELAQCRDLAHRALELSPTGNPWLCVTTFSLGSSLYAGGDLAAAVPVLTEALRLSQADGALYIQLLAGSFLADIQVYQGRLGSATEMYHQVLEWGGNSIPQKGALLAHAGLANILCEQNQLDAAFLNAQSGIEQIEHVGGPGVALWLYRTLARIQQARGNPGRALEAVDQAYISARTLNPPL